MSDHRHPLCSRLSLAKPSRVGSITGWSAGRSSVRVAMAGFATAILTASAAVGAEQWHLEMVPGLHLDQHSSLVAVNGFVCTFGDQRVMGDAVRIDTKQQDLYATGHVVYIRPGVRIHADWLGVHPEQRTGEGSNAQVFLEANGRTIRARARRVVIEHDRIVLRNVEVDLGNGGILSYYCPTIRIYLFDKPKVDRDGFERFVSGVDVVAPTARIIGVPVLWLPYLYRDFTLDYPWSKVLFGASRRLGKYVHYWVGSNLPVVADWHTRLELRGDDNTRAGIGFGANGFWRHEDFGHGMVEYFEMPKEHVAGGVNDADEAGRRRARLVDVEHQLDLGHGAFYGRFVAEPAPDPLVPGAVPPTAGSDERFRADFFRSDLDHRPFARQGAALAYGFPIGTLAVDTQRNPRRDYTATERWIGLHAEMVPLEVAGPLHAEGWAWEEDLHRIHADTSADRLRGEASLGGLQWFGGFGLDAAGGGRALRYDHGRILGADLSGEQERHLAFTTSGARLRFIAEGESWTHIVVPRLGIDMSSPGFGDVLPAYGFGDARDVLEEDKRYYTAGVETSFTKDGYQLRARVNSRWAMRDEDRLFVDAAGVLYQGRTRFADITGDIDGQVGRRLTLTGSFAYDDRPRQLTSLYGSGSYLVSEHLTVHHIISLLSDLPGSAPTFENEPGFSVKAERYSFDGSVTLRPGGRPVDIWFAQISRDMVDGQLSISYEYQLSPTGSLYDQRFGIGFTLVGTENGGTGHSGTSYSIK